MKWSVRAHNTPGATPALHLASISGSEKTNGTVLHKQGHLSLVNEIGMKQERCQRGKSSQLDSLSIPHIKFVNAQHYYDVTISI